MIFKGKYCEGSGCGEKLKHIDDSLSMLYPTAALPNISMIYNPEGDAFKEGFIWGNGFWIQNSYGFVYGANPFLSSPFSRVLQNSLDKHWSHMGDGSRIGTDNQIPSEARSHSLCAPDGSLGDCVTDEGIVYKQGDGNVDEYDWFYEATAAGLNMEADILLADHDVEKIRKYMPLMSRSVEFIEGARDPSNNLFLVGPSANLLAPSYGAARDPKTGELQKCYLTGLSITYCAALEKLRELALLIGETDRVSLYDRRIAITKASLPLLLTDEGYFLNYMERDGTPHGLYGAEKHGYLEGVCNIDAIAFDIAGDELSESIYKKIASVPKIREFDFLANNYPALDDTPWAINGNCGFREGDWVDGGCWGTVEGRAMLAYTRLGKFDDAFRSSERNMRWAEDYRQDEPYSQWGENSHNPWAKETEAGKYDGDIRLTGIMIDNYAAPVCLARGLLGVKYTHDSVLIRPRIPADIEIYFQKVPLRFGGKEIYVKVLNGAPRDIEIKYDDIKDESSVAEIDMNAGTCRLTPYEPASERELEIGALPEELSKIYKTLADKYLSMTKTGRESEYGTYLGFAIDCFKAAAERRNLSFDKENFRPMTEKKKAEIISIYDTSAMNAYKGLKHHWR